MFTYDCDMAPLRAGMLLTFLVLLLAFCITPALSLPLLTSPTCRQDLSIVWKLLGFFATNFLAHAATVPPSLDTDTYIRIGRSKIFIPWPPIVALFLPNTGLIRSCFMMLHAYYVSCLDEVSIALMSGAMIIVAREPCWEPPEGREELVHVRLPEGFDDIPDQDSAEPFAQIEVEPLGEKVEEIDPSDWPTYGDVQVPEGYTCCVHNALGNIEFAQGLLLSNVEDTRDIKLCRPKSWTAIILSIVQLVSAIISLYDSRGDQINRFGYAAYGLSVAPYALMSLVNLLCAGHRGEWPCRYVLRTAILEEAERRESARFDGAVGVVKPLELADDEEKASLTESVDPDIKDGYTAAYLSVEIEPGSASKTLVVRVDGIRRRFRLSPTTSAGSSAYTFGVASINDRVSPSAPTEMEFFGTHYPFPSFKFLVLAINFVLFIALLYAGIILPYVIIFVLTRFKPGQSTVGERAWMMAWVVASQVSGFTWGFLFLARLSRTVFWVLLPVLMTPAVGGFYFVAKMYLEDNGYHRC